MALPTAPNTTCDIYRVGVIPPQAPSVAGVACHLRQDWRSGQEAGDRPSSGALTWTHVLLVEANVDVRDRYVGDSTTTVNFDTVYIPNQNGTGFGVVFVALVHRGTPSEHKIVYLDRLAPNWPTNNL